ncbi:hypothetical protein EVJ25_12385 [Exiguobacterium sp. SH1S4]|nr:hypothetical protein EVJ31_13775 [Exiguobacterium sp. SH5S32]TCI50154.1 hypothetical protein EVJ25_12385 [Exiguobacterium sp. SH1S4]TCI67557.1 hypothetical protein EVJ23_13765 [Exiguobacterium sp. SH1S1]
MGEQISIELNVDSLTYETQIVGDISFIIDSYIYFPGHGWSDFVVIVLKWWIDSCRALLSAPLHEKYSFSFMDGRDDVIARKVNATEAELLYVGSDTRHVLMGTVLIEELKQALIKTTYQLLNAIDRNGWENEEAETLRHAVKSLERI